MSEPQPYKEVYLAAKSRITSLEAECDNLRGLVEELELDLREALFMSHLHMGKYGDDGEMQCNRLDCLTDFRRDDIAEIHVKNMKAGTDYISERDALKGLVEELTDALESAEIMLKADDDLLGSSTETLKEVQAALAHAEKLRGMGPTKNVGTKSESTAIKEEPRE